MTCTILKEDSRTLVWVLMVLVLSSTVRQGSGPARVGVMFFEHAAAALIFCTSKISFRKGNARDKLPKHF